jgi:heat shock protein HslJ
MDARIVAALAVSLLAFTACEKAPPPAPGAAPEPAAKPAPARETDSFVGRVWEVVESQQVARGSLRVFLPDGKLVMSDPNATPAFGSWRQVDGHLTIVEDGIEYPVDILELSDSAFRIRILSPGEPVEILFAPAAEHTSDAITSARQAPAATQAAAQESPLWGTTWRLENLAGAGVLDRVQATLEFPSEGRVSGNGSCNRFNGIVTMEGGTIEVGGVAATRKACPEAVMRQEENYFAALRAAERFELAGDSLRIHAKDQAEPLRFVMIPATETKALNVIERAPASAPSPLNGIWTIVAHHAPGISALSDEQARARYGDTLRLTAGSAISSSDQCREPRYSTSSVPAAS